MKSARSMKHCLKIPIKTGVGLFLIGIAGLAACNPSEPFPAASSPAVQIISLATTPAVSAWEGVFSSCAAGLPGVGLVTDEYPPDRIGQSGSDIRLSAGNIPGLPGAVSFALGQDEITVIAHSANPVTDLDFQSLFDLFSGKIKTWDTLASASGQKGLASLPVQIWSYPDGDEVRKFFDQAVDPDLQGPSSNANSLIVYTAPDPQAMITAVGQNPGAIGYVLKSSLVNSSQASLVHPVSLDAAASPTLAVNIRAELKAQPQGALQQLLLCVQAKKAYSPP